MRRKSDSRLPGIDEQGKPPSATTVVLLPGALLPASPDLVRRLARTRRVVSIVYPDTDRMSDLVDAIARQLDGDGGVRFDVIGFSFGGWVAQCLAQRHPMLVRNLVLAHSFALRPRDAWRFRLGLMLWALIPAPVFRGLVRKRVARMLEPARRVSTGEYQRLLSEVRDVIDAGDVATVVRRQNLCLLESCNSFGRTTGETSLAAPRVLIIESDNDPAVRARDRAHLRARHADARVHTFRGTGHVSALVAPDAFADAIEGFLDREDPTPTAGTS